MDVNMGSLSTKVELSHPVEATRPNSIEVPCGSREPPLLLLPTEIRLEIYSNCTAFTLLQLSHTSTELHREINAYPGLIGKTYGYICPEVYDYRSLAEIRSIDRSPLCFNINFIGSLLGSREVKLFNNQYLPLQGLTYVDIDPQDAVLDGKTKKLARLTWHVCKRCKIIKPSDMFAGKGLMMEEDRTVWSMCARCRWQRRVRENPRIRGLKRPLAVLWDLRCEEEHWMSPRKMGRRQEHVRRVMRYVNLSMAYHSSAATD
ncbi:hypothetical protein BJ508DRAFT_419586 [Ascobolus immersus RN42]|uniref:F-box domain-containing protein n=1 Tax=Ascobolus immersus RN42 TaxID=1160509 RepID=A0A3N4HF23_ASCIM|nr:hypothetical protein BJ508DRAFT_419586 [Ascobolus immersus RN42]